MYKNLPYLLIGAGILLLVGAFYFAAGNSIPYQDATPEMLARQASRATLFKLVSMLGALDLVAGLFLLWKRRRDSNVGQ